MKHGEIRSGDQPWDEQIGEFIADGTPETWRAFCDRLTVDLLARLGPTTVGRRAFKTDLFDEALGDGVISTLNTLATDVFGTDISSAVAETAQRRNRFLHVVESDVRALPLADHSIDFILSNSTLDHFESRDDIGCAVEELHRVLAPGGELLITLDNPLNPVVALRSMLPIDLLRKSRIVPYFVGATLSMKHLVRLLESTGFRVEGTGTLMHVPRFFALHMAHRNDSRRQTGPNGRTIARMLRWEWLDRLPTRQFTSHFIAVRAVKL